jgi:MoaA/NifB/PqqE/SkfB family radical SAM enzyme
VRVFEFNPFNPNKLFAQYHRWSHIRQGQPIPAPSFITVDPISVCNFDCYWCNSRAVLQGSNGAKIDRDLLLQLPDFLKQWRSEQFSSFGCHAVCVAGGGESLLHPDIDSFLTGLYRQHIKAGVITNGVFIDQHISALSNCCFVGVSVDAGTAEVYETIKGSKSHFYRVINGIDALVTYAKEFDTTLSRGSGRGVGYKFLILPENVHELYEATRTAFYLGCSYFQARPADNYCDKTSVLQTGWTEEKLEELQHQICFTEQCALPKVPCYISTDKFDRRLNRLPVPYDTCVIGAMTALLSPSETNGIQLSFCCDRRGDHSLVGIEDTHNLNDIAAFWGSEQHWALIRNIDTKKCPRCTCLRHLDIYYNAILDDSMTVDLI